jgi:hypothetical protein
MPRIVIHAGPSKTGSTTLQNYLVSDKARLGGWTYPDIGRVRSDMGQHNVFYDAADNGRADPAVSGLPAYRQLLRKGGDVVLSSEDVPLWPKALGKIVRPAQRNGYDITFVFFVRDPIERLNSMYTQQTKTLAEALDFRPFVEKARGGLTLFPFSRVRQIVEGFEARLLLLPFLPGRMHEVYGWLADWMGVELPIVKDDVTNEGPSYDEIALYREMGDRLRGTNYWGPMIRGARTHGDGRKFQGFDDALYAETRAFFAEEYGPANCRLLACFGDAFQDALFTGTDRHDPRIDPARFAAYRAYVEARLNLAPARAPT